MKTIIDNLEIISNSFLKPKKEDEKREKKLDNSEELATIETSQIMEQSELDQYQYHSCPYSPNKRKKSDDSNSICGSQVETLSQTSESSFFRSYTSPIYQMTSSSSNDVVQVGENNDSFFAGVEEHFQKLMPEKFINYTKTRNYIHKSTFSKKMKLNININKTGTTTDTNINNNPYMNNYFYYPVIYCPINTFYLNNIQNMFVNNNNNNDQGKKGYNRKRYKKDIINITTEQKNEQQNKEEKDKIKNENDHEIEVIKEVIKEDDKQEKKDNYEVEQECVVDEKQERYQNYRNNYNYNSYKNKWQDHNYRNKYNYNYNSNNQRAYNYNYNKKYNNYSNNYYDSNDDIREERTRFYHNNNHQKRRYQKPYENKFSKYK